MARKELDNEELRGLRKAVDGLLETADDVIFWFNKTFQKLIDSPFMMRLHHRMQKVNVIGCRDLPLAELLYYFKSGIGQGKVWQRAKGLAYSLLMALPPLLIFLFTLVAYFPVDGVQNELLNQLGTIIPGNFFNRVADTVNEVLGHKNGSLMSIGFIATIILATNGMYGCMMSMNYANTTVKRKGFLVRYALSMLLVFLLFILLTAAMSLLVGYKVIIGFLISKGWVAETRLSMIMFSFGRWVILIFLTLLTLILVYRFAVGDRQQRKKVRFFSIGSIVATILFFILTWGFQIYLNFFNHYNLLYGSIGTLLMIMLWLFANCYVLLFGYEVNTSVIESHENASQWIGIQAEIEARRAERRARRLRLAAPEQTPEVVDDEPHIKDNEIMLTVRMVLQNKKGRWVTRSTKIVDTKTINMDCEEGPAPLPASEIQESQTSR